MSTLLVLGIIPGTSIQISFEIWLAAMAALLVMARLIRVLRINLRKPVYAEESIPQPAKVIRRNRQA